MAAVAGARRREEPEHPSTQVLDTIVSVLEQAHAAATRSGSRGGSIGHSRNLVRAAIVVGPVQKAAPLQVRLIGMSRRASGLAAMREESTDLFLACFKVTLALRSDCSDMKAGRLLGMADLLASHISDSRVKLIVSEGDRLPDGRNSISFSIIMHFTGKDEARRMHEAARQFEGAGGDWGAILACLSSELRASKDLAGIFSGETGGILDLDVAATVCADLREPVVESLERALPEVHPEDGHSLGLPADAREKLLPIIFGLVRSLRGATTKLRYESLAKLALAFGGRLLDDPKHFNARKKLAAGLGWIFGMRPTEEKTGGAGEGTAAKGGGGSGNGDAEAARRLYEQVTASVDSVVRAEVIFRRAVLRAEVKGLGLGCLPSRDEMQEAVEAEAKADKARRIESRLAYESEIGHSGVGRKGKRRGRERKLE